MLSHNAQNKYTLHFAPPFYTFKANLAELFMVRTLHGPVGASIQSLSKNFPEKKKRKTGSAAARNEFMQLGGGQQGNKATREGNKNNSQPKEKIVVGEPILVP